MNAKLLKEAIKAGCKTAKDLADFHKAMKQKEHLNGQNRTLLRKDLRTA